MMENDHKRAPQTRNIVNKRIVVGLVGERAPLQRSELQAHVPMPVPVASSQLFAVDPKPHPLKTISPPVCFRISYQGCHIL